MKTKTLIITTVLGSGLLFSYNPAYAKDSITDSTAKTGNAPTSSEAISDPRIAAGSFVEHVNYARVALAMKNTDLARQHITQARNMATIIQSTATDQRLISRVESGRIVYQYDTAHKYHYFPIQTGPVQVKQMSSGPAWAKNDLAVTDADIVYLTLDLTDNKADIYLTAAEVAINKNDLKEADDQLASLTDDIVSVDSKVSVPSDKAQDNIALARNFMAGKNYDGARFALKHADDALNEMQQSARYKSHLSDIAALRREVDIMQTNIAKKDPSTLEQADKKLTKWWGDVKTWFDDTNE